MPCRIATVGVVVGQAVDRGTTLLSLEAMKMEAPVRADRDSIVAEVLADPGQQDAKDRLVVFA